MRALVSRCSSCPSSPRVILTRCVVVAAAASVLQMGSDRCIHFFSRKKRITGRVRRTSTQLQTPTMNQKRTRKYNHNVLKEREEQQRHEQRGLETCAASESSLTRVPVCLRAS